MVTAFCVKCRTKVEMNNPVSKINSRGVKMLQSKCTTCGSLVKTFVKKEVVVVPLPTTDNTPVATNE